MSAQIATCGDDISPINFTKLQVTLEKTNQPRNTWTDRLQNNKSNKVFVRKGSPLHLAALIQYFVTTYKLLDLKPKKVSIF